MNKIKVKKQKVTGKEFVSIYRKRHKMKPYTKFCYGQKKIVATRGIFPENSFVNYVLLQYDNERVIAFVTTEEKAFISLFQFDIDCFKDKGIEDFKGTLYIYNGKFDDQNNEDLRKIINKESRDLVTKLYGKDIKIKEEVA